EFTPVLFRSGCLPRPPPRGRPPDPPAPRGGAPRRARFLCRNRSCRAHSPIAGHREAGSAQLRELVAQCPIADSEPRRRLLAAAGAVTKRADDAPRLLLPKLGGETRRLLLVELVEHEVRRVDPRSAVGEHERALNHVVELADVAGPAVALERVGRLGRKPRRGATRMAREEPL